MAMIVVYCCIAFVRMGAITNAHYDAITLTILSPIVLFLLIKYPKFGYMGIIILAILGYFLLFYFTIGVTPTDEMGYPIIQRPINQWGFLILSCLID